MHFGDGGDYEICRLGTAMLAPFGERSLSSHRRDAYAFIESQIPKATELVFAGLVVGRSPRGIEKLQADRSAKSQLISLDQLGPAL